MIEADYPPANYEKALEEFKSKRITTIKDGKTFFSPKGKGMAHMIVRRHRLAERLIADALGKLVLELNDNQLAAELSMARN